MGSCLSSPVRHPSLRRSRSAAAALQRPMRPASTSSVTPGAARCCRSALLPGPDPRQACSLLHVAAAAGHEHCLHELLSVPGVRPDSPDAAASQSGQTPLMRAAAAVPPHQPSAGAPRQPPSGSLVQSLLDAGASVKQADSRGWQALHYAAAAGHGAAIEKLVAAGADPAARTRDGRQTAYELAAAAGHREAARLLLRLLRQRWRGRSGGAQAGGSSSETCGPPSAAEAAAIAAEMRAEAAEAAAARSQQQPSPAGVRRGQAERSRSLDGSPACARPGTRKWPGTAQAPLAERQVAAARAAAAQLAAALARAGQVGQPQEGQPGLRGNSPDGGAAAGLAPSAPAPALSPAARDFLRHPQLDTDGIESAGSPRGAAQPAPGAAPTPTGATPANPPTLVALVVPGCECMACWIYRLPASPKESARSLARLWQCC